MPHIYCSIDDNVHIDKTQIIITSKNITKTYEFNFINKFSIVINDNVKIIYYECSYNSNICYVTKKKINKNRKYYFNSICSIINPNTYTIKNITQSVNFVTFGCYGSFVIYGFPKIIKVYEQIKTFYDSRCLPNELLLYIIEIYLATYHHCNFIKKPLRSSDLIYYNNYFDIITHSYMSGYTNNVYSLEGLKILYQKGFINLCIFSIIDDCYITLTPETYYKKQFTNHFNTLNDFIHFRDRCAKAIFG